MQAFSDWLAATSVSRLFADLSWFVPTIQSIHILAIAAVVTLLGMLNFRLLRITRSGPSLQNLAAGYVPWVWRALVVLLITGILLTITEPARELMNDVFRLKMLLVVALVILTIVLRATIRRSPEYWTSTPQRRRLGSTIAAASLILCVGIVAAGRLIAYV
jgi:hypothetical protein